MKPAPEIARVSAPFAVYGLSALVALTPWFYGATPDWAVEWVVGWLALVVLIAMMELLGRRCMPCGLSRLAAAAIMALFLQGFWMAFNSQGIFDPAFWTQIAVAAPFPELPGAFDAVAAQSQMARYSVLAAVILLAAQAVGDPAWRGFSLRLLAVSAIGLVVIGLAQRIGGAQDIYWGDRAIGNFFFATWRYHGNAGAFLNLVWPATAWALLEALRNGQRWLGVLWGMGLLVHTAGLFVHGSRLASLLALPLIAGWVWLNRRTLAELMRRAGRAALLASALGAVTLSAGLVLPSVWDSTYLRWSKLSLHWDQETGTMSRLPAWKAAFEMLPEAGAWGVGPGSFAWRFRDYCADEPELLKQLWRYTHQDYLQFFIEWGWVGGALFVFLLAGALVRLAWGMGTLNDRRLRRVLILGLGVTAAHAMMDFPFQILSIQLPCALFMGMAWAGRRRSKSGTEG